MEQKKRKAVRGLREQLLTLINGWDPAGVLESGGQRDEYGRVVDELLSLLSQQPTTKQLAHFLESEIAEYFGAVPNGASQFATKAISWYRIASAE